MDNRTIDVVSEGTEGIAHAVAIIWPNTYAEQFAKYYTILKLAKKTTYTKWTSKNSDEEQIGHYSNLVEDPDGIPTLILLKYEDIRAKELPFPLTKKEAVDFIIAWLSKTPYPESKFPDIDGECKAGWRIFTESWGHVAGYSAAILGVQPAVAMYGK